MNKCAKMSRTLGVKCRCSGFGISIISEDEAKFFSLDSLYMDNGKSCKDYIKEVCNPELQTTLL